MAQMNPSMAAPAAATAAVPAPALVCSLAQMLEISLALIIRQDPVVLAFPSSIGQSACVLKTTTGTSVSALLRAPDMQASRPLVKSIWHKHKLGCMVRAVYPWESLLFLSAFNRHVQSLLTCCISGISTEPV